MLRGKVLEKFLLHSDPFIERWCVPVDAFHRRVDGITVANDISDPDHSLLDHRPLVDDQLR